MEEKIRKCPECGNIYQEGSKFCVYCGRPLSNYTETKSGQKEEKNIGKAELKKILSSPDMFYNGKKICEELRKLRLQFAKENKLQYEEEECTHNGPCNGTCSYCEKKLDELNLAAEAAGIIDTAIYSNAEINRIIMQNSSPRLMGQIRMEDPPLELERNKKKSFGVFERVKKALRK